MKMLHGMEWFSKKNSVWISIKKQTKKKLNKYGME